MVLRNRIVGDMVQAEVGDLADKASLDHDREVEVGVASIRFEDRREAERNAEIAKSRKEAGSFGVCEDCGNPISLKRLAAVPNAVKCTECKERAELLYRGRFGLRQ